MINRRVKNILLLSLFLFGIWFLLTYPVGAHKLLLGIAISLGVSLALGAYSRPIGDLKITPKSLIYGVVYILVFFWELVKSNFDVAFRVLNPRLPINPGIVKVKTNLKSELGRIVLANSITLTPGTLTVETKGEYFYIHWIDVTAENIDESSEKIISKFEKYLEVIFG